MTSIAVGPDKFQKGFSDGQDLLSIPRKFRVREIREALEAEYRSDAHLAIYVFPDINPMPRVNKPSLEFVKKHHLQVQSFFCDVDNPGHGPWTDDLLAKAKEQYATLEILQTAGIYHTKNGARIVQPIARPIPVWEAEPYIFRWFKQLYDAGIAVDFRCREWNHLFRLPNVYRDKVMFRSPLMLLDRMKPIELEPIDLKTFQMQVPESALPKQKTTSNKTTTSIPQTLLPALNWSGNLSEDWRERVETIAEAISEIETEWHSLFMAIAGSLISHHVPLEKIPAINQAISHSTRRDTRTEDRVNGAKTTIEKYRQGLPHTGHTKLSELWPSVAAAVEEAMGDYGAQVNPQDVEYDPNFDSLTYDETEHLLEFTEWLTGVIDNAPSGVSMVSAGRFLHKHQATINVAKERANKDYSSPNAKGVQAPLFSKTAIILKSNAKALTDMDLLKHRGVDVKRRFGPLSMMDEKNKPICKYYNSARYLVSGGQTMQLVMCRGHDDENKCKHYDECDAKDGIEGDEKARVILGTHPLAGVLSDLIGENELLVMEGPPNVLESFAVTLKEFDITNEVLHCFDEQFSISIEPALEGLLKWVEFYGTPGVATSVPDVLGEVFLEIDSFADARSLYHEDLSDLLESTADSQLPNRKGYAPPIKPDVLQEAKNDSKLAENLGIASKVLGAILQGAKKPEQLMLRIDQGPLDDDEDTQPTRTLVVTRVRDYIIRAIDRIGPVVIIEDDAKTKLPVYSKLLGHKPRVYEYDPDRDAVIDRTCYQYNNATRKNWSPSGKLTLAPSFLTAIKKLFEWASEHPEAKTLGIVSTKVIELALLIARDPEDKALIESWRGLNQPEEVLESIRKDLTPIVCSWQGELYFGHYGSLHDADSMVSADCIATIGDPWPTARIIRDEVTFLGDATKLSDRMKEICQSTLKNAHALFLGTRNGRPGRALHIGKILPGGPEWSEDKVNHRNLIDLGRPKNEKMCIATSAIKKLVDLVGSHRATAKLVGCDHTTILRYVRGSVPTPTNQKKLKKLLKEYQI